MTTGSYNESAYEKAVLDLLAEEGWTVEYGPDIERDYSDPTWDEVLRERVFAINRDTPNAERSHQRGAREGQGHCRRKRSRAKRRVHRLPAERSGGNLRFVRRRAHCPR